MAQDYSECISKMAQYSLPELQGMNLEELLEVQRSILFPDEQVLFDAEMPVVLPPQDPREDFLDYTDKLIVRLQLQQQGEGKAEDKSTPSKALVIMDGKRALLMLETGDLVQETREISRWVDELGLPMPPYLGLCIWEGSVHYHEDDKYRIDPEFVGAYRSLTPEELNDLANGAIPWANKD